MSGLDALRLECLEAPNTASVFSVGVFIIGVMTSSAEGSPLSLGDVLGGVEMPSWERSAMMASEAKSQPARTESGGEGFPPGVGGCSARAGISCCGVPPSTRGSDCRKESVLLLLLLPFEPLVRRLRPLMRMCRERWLSYAAVDGIHGSLQIDWIGPKHTELSRSI